MCYEKFFIRQLYTVYVRILYFIQSYAAKPGRIKCGFLLKRENTRI